MKKIIGLIVVFVAILELPLVHGQETQTILNNAKILAQVNAIRKKGCQCGKEYFPPVQPLSWSDTLEKVALLHSTDMVDNDYFSHTGLDNSTINDRVQRTGYAVWMVGENIAEGYETPAAVVKAWLESPEHCANMMRAVFVEIGVQRKGNMWTMVLATRKPASIPARKEQKQ